MKIALFGATGGTGREILQQALAAGLGVRALVRNPDALAVEDPKLELVEGNVLDPDDVSATLDGTDAVVVSLGNTANNPNYVVSDGTRNIVNAMEAQGLRRIIVISSLGVGDSRDQVPLAFKMIMKTVLRHAMEDKERQEALIRASDLDWTIVRPGGLTDGPATGDYLFGTDPAIMSNSISRADVARFALRQLEEPGFLRQAPAIVGS